MMSANKILLTSRAELDLLGKKIKRDGINTCDYHSYVTPKKYMISIKKNKDIYKLIKQSGVFCINFINENNEILKEIEKYNSEFIDKFSKLSISREECKKLDCPRITWALKHIECEVIEEREHEGYVEIIGNILYSIKKPLEDSLNQS